MTLSYFQSYELRRKQFKPDTVWVDKGGHIIKKLMVLDKSKLPPGTDISYDFCSGSNSNVTFRIIDSTPGYERFNLVRPGRIIEWSKEYMKTYYKPLTNE